MNQIFQVRRYITIVDGIVGHLVILCNNLRVGYIAFSLHCTTAVIAALLTGAGAYLPWNIDLLILALIAACSITSIGAAAAALTLLALPLLTLTLLTRFALCRGCLRLLIRLLSRRLCLTLGLLALCAICAGGQVIGNLLELLRCLAESLVFGLLLCILGGCFLQRFCRISLLGGIAIGQCLCQVVQG